MNATTWLWILDYTFALSRFAFRFEISCICMERDFQRFFMILWFWHWSLVTFYIILLFIFFLYFSFIFSRHCFWFFFHHVLLNNDKNAPKTSWILFFFLSIGTLGIQWSCCCSAPWRIPWDKACAYSFWILVVPHPQH